MTNIILDLDTGIDDTLALLYVIARRDEFNLLGVTSTFGNVETETSARNSLTILDLFGRTDVPVFIGESAPEGKTSYQVMPYIYRIHGRNGLGDVDFPRSERKPEDESASSFIMRMIASHPDDLTIVATGPLRNLAEVYRQYPETVKIPHKVISMGGALTVEGNVTPFAEANYYKDPKSASFVFSLPIDLIQIPLDVTERSHLYLSGTEEWKSERGMLIRKMTEFYIGFHKKDFSYLHDPSAVCAALHPEYFSYLSLPMKITDDGRSIGDWLSAIPEKKVAVDVRTDCVEEELKRSWKELLG
ncbi:MAG: nucleoside hydrolase [Bullifex sp.]|nr:nucleoside hydrolase [Bullifex sp.]